MKYKSTDKAECYFPPILGNGEIAFSADFEGATDFTSQDYPSIHASNGGIFRAGRRLPILHGKTPSKILSFGRISFDCGSKIKEWEQELIPEKGMQRSLCNYDGGVEVRSEYFIHANRNLYALNKCFFGDYNKRTISFTYKLCGYDDDTNNAITLVDGKKSQRGAEFDFRVVGQDVYTGRVSVFLDREAKVTLDGNTATLECEISAGESITLFLLLEDDLYGEDYEKIISNTEKLCRTTGFSGMLSESTAEWKKYFSMGYVKTEDEKLNSIYKTSLYHLKCYTTRWSIPVGLNDCAWSGKFFAFDEYYSFLGLLGSGRLSLAKRVPEFRLRVCLEKAIQRATHLTDEQAHFPWETNEYGDEVSPIGFWYEHIFHMALVAIGAYEYYWHSQDRAFLVECRRMIRACAKFYTLHMLYERNGELYIGKCTDIERLGSSVENPFMTCCGVIKTLETYASVCDILGGDEDYRDECRASAEKLRKSLPNDGRMYIPYSGCPQKSVVVFAGKFPYDVIDKSDKKMLSAWSDFIENEKHYGNMYVGGTHVSPWYACWKAEGYARCGMGKEAYTALKQAYEEVGVFDEMFEINEPGKRCNPWFTTASGIYLSTVNEMLLQSDGSRIDILPSYPNITGDISFKLSAKGGVTVEAKICGEKIEALTITAKDGVARSEFDVYFRGKHIGRIKSI